MNNEIFLRRFSYSNQGTFGILEVRSGQDIFTCYTIENPWKNNEPKISCIPTGWYELKQRRSPVTERTTRGEFPIGWEVTNVIGRTFIMIHPANVASDVLGCIGVGEDLGFVKEQWAVTKSVDTHRKLRKILDTRQDWILKIVGEPTHVG